MRRVLLAGPALFAAWAACLVSACDKDVTSSLPSGTVSIVVSPGALTLQSIGATRQFVAVARDVGGGTVSPAPVTWSSSVAAVATVDPATGVATAVGNGETAITATAGAVTGSATLTVAQTVVSVAVSPTSASLPAIGDTTRFRATAMDSLGHPVTGVKFLWLSTNTSVAVVDSGGLATSTGDGTALMTASGRGVAGQSRLTVALLAFTAISSGGVSSCSLTDAGAAYCWGYNGLGELGNGTTTNSDAPVAVAGGLKFANVSAGGFSHGCGATAANQGYCWGGNANGELGDGTTTNRAAPVLVAGGLAFVQLSAGFSHSCGLTVAGQAYCWGSNLDGQLGVGDTLNRSVPTAVVGGLSFASVSTTAFSSCGLTPAGAAWCWGINNFGQLGNGTTTNSSTPVLVSGGLSFSTIAVDGTHTCGLTAAGNAYCWGANTFGELGTGTTTNSSVPVAVIGPLTFGSLAAGSSFTCGIATGGGAYCWGNNANGQLGNGSLTSSTSPVAVTGGASFSRITAGFTFACALTPAGAAYCWGYDQFQDGLLGNGTTNSSLVPVRVVQ